MGVAMRATALVRKENILNDVVGDVVLGGCDYDVDV